MPGSISPFGPLTPAAFTSTSRRPCSDATRSNAAFTCALSETSTTIVDTPSSPRAVSSSPASSMSTASTVAPSSANRCVVARPIPDPPPVTRAILSFSSILLSSVEADVYAAALRPTDATARSRAGRASRRSTHAAIAGNPSACPSPTMSEASDPMTTSATVSASPTRNS